MTNTEIIATRLASVNQTLTRANRMIQKPQEILAYFYGMRDALMGKPAAFCNPSYELGYEDGVEFIGGLE